MRIFPPHATDFYKTGHIRQYPAGTTLVYSNFTCRSDKLAPVLPDFDHRVVFFGLQGLAQWMLIDSWNAEFFSKPKQAVVARYNAAWMPRSARARSMSAISPRCTTLATCRC